jgi:hypothetical protein
MLDTLVRLGCKCCLRDDKDRLTPEQLERAIAEGWTKIECVQTEEEASQTYDDPADEPPGFDILAWFTHQGTCPRCQDCPDLD